MKEEAGGAPASWTVADVAGWATKAGLVPASVTALAENQVDGPTLVTLTKSDLQSELGISSLPARRYLWELIKSLKSEQDTSDYCAAVEVHEEEIQVFAASVQQQLAANASGDGADTASGHNKSNSDMPASMKVVVDEMADDAQIRRQTLEDRLLAFRVQRAMHGGQVTYEDAELAHQEQERLNQLQQQSERDREYAETLATGRELASLQARRRQDEAASRREEDAARPSSTGTTESHVASLFGLCIQTCAENKVNVAEAFRSGKLKPLPLHTSALVSDDEDSDVEGSDDVKETNMSLGNLPLLEQCNVCYDDNIRGYHLACGHRQCTQCMRKLFKTSLRDTALLPLRCCELPIDMNIATQLLDQSQAKLILQRTEERTAGNKMYCPSCSVFLNLDTITNTTMDSTDTVCDCGAGLCLQCKTISHPGVPCSQNQSQSGSDDETILALSREQGWKQCPNCAMMIELRSGCNHMTCTTCAHEFCYRCLNSWNTMAAKCSSGACELWDEERLVEAGELRVQQEEAQRGIVLPQAIRRERLQRAVEGLRANEICHHEWTRSGGFKGDCPNCGFTMYSYGMRCDSDCGSTVCYTCAHHRIPQRGWR